MADEQGRKSVEELRREIELTRAHMERTVNSLESRLNPTHLKQQATEAIREQTVGRVEELADQASDKVKGAGNDVFEAIKKNPLPAAMAAIGLGWLFMESRSENRRHSSYDSRDYRYSGQPGPGGRFQAEPRRDAAADYRYGSQYSAYPRERQWESSTDYRSGEQGRMHQDGPNIGQRAGNVASTVGDKASNVASSVADTAGDVASSVGNTASNMASSLADTAGNVASSLADTAGNVASTVGDTAQDLAYRTREGVEQLGEAAQHGASRARTRFEGWMEDSPLLVGLGAVALGAAVGMSLPHTQMEDQFIGEKRDEFVDMAQDRAQETMHKAQVVAKEAGQVVSDAAKETTEQVKETVKQEAKRQNLTGS